jgi:hypothetical protein
MKTEALFLLLILILGLFLCSFLGGNCGKESFTSTTTSTNLATGTTYTDTNGNSITVISGNNGEVNLQLIQVGQSTPIILTSTPPTGVTYTANTYYAQAPLKFTATVTTGSNGQSVIEVNLANGQTIYLTQTSSTSSSSTSSSSTSTSESRKILNIPFSLTVKSEKKTSRNIRRTSSKRIKRIGERPSEE